MKELIGKTITGLSVEKEAQGFLRFDTTEGPVTYITSGDCCSETWFADITGVFALIGGKVMKVEEINMNSFKYNLDDGRCRQDCDQAYGYKIVTTKGMADIIFRNSSNGYYGGEIELFDANHWHHDHYKDRLVMEPITEDWQAK